MSNIGSITFGLTGGPSGSYNINTASTSSTLNISASSNLTLDASTNVIIDASGIILDASGISLTGTSGISLVGATSITGGTLTAGDISGNNLSVGSGYITTTGAISGGAISGGDISGNNLSVGSGYISGGSLIASNSASNLSLYYDANIQNGTNIINSSASGITVLADGNINLNSPLYLVNGATTYGTFDNSNGLYIKGPDGQNIVLDASVNSVYCYTGGGDTTGLVLQNNTNAYGYLTNTTYSGTSTFSINTGQGIPLILTSSGNFNLCIGTNSLGNINMYQSSGLFYIDSGSTELVLQTTNSVATPYVAPWNPTGQGIINQTSLASIITQINMPSNSGPTIYSFIGSSNYGNAVLPSSDFSSDTAVIGVPPHFGIYLLSLCDFGWTQQTTFYVLILSSGAIVCTVLFGSGCFASQASSSTLSIYVPNASSNGCAISWIPLLYD